MKKDIIIDSQIGLIIERIIEEKRTQASFNKIPFEGVDFDTICNEVFSRLGGDTDPKRARRELDKLLKVMSRRSDVWLSESDR
jgi:hypothetical protein